MLKLDVEKRMNDDLESAFGRLLKTVIGEVALELLNEHGLLDRIQSHQSVDLNGPFLLTSRETAKRLSISERHLFSLTKSGVLPSVRVGQRVHYSVETIQRWIRESEGAGKSSVKTDNRATSTAHAISRPKTVPKPTAKRSPAKKAVPVVEPKPKKADTPSQSDPKNTEERRTPFTDLLNEVGIQRSSLPPLTNGELMRIAEVDLPTFHGWMYLNRELPETARNKLKEHFRDFQERSVI